MSPGTRPSVPRTSGRLTPWSIPTPAPSAPGNVPNRLSNVRFSFTRNTTCLIGVVVMNDDASIVVAGSEELVGVAEMFGGVGGAGADRSVHAAPTASAIATPIRAMRHTARSPLVGRRGVPDRPAAVGAQRLRVRGRWLLGEVHRVAQAVGDAVAPREERTEGPVVLDEPQHA